MNFPIKPLLREIEEIGEMGFDYVELTMDPPEATPQKILGTKTGDSGDPSSIWNGHHGTSSHFCLDLRPL